MPIFFFGPNGRLISCVCARICTVSKIMYKLGMGRESPLTYVVFIQTLSPNLHIMYLRFDMLLVSQLKSEECSEFVVSLGRVCPFTGKKSNKANKVSHSNHKTKRLQFVNLQYKRIWWEAGKRYVKLRLSTKAIKTIEKNGLDAVAKKAGIDLSKE